MLHKSILFALALLIFTSGRIQGKDPEDVDLRVDVSGVSSSSSSRVIEEERAHAQLMCAISLGQVDQVDMLISKRVNVNAVDRCGYTALMAAAQGESIEIVERLLGVGAEIDFENIYGWTALMYAASKRQYAIVKLLLERGAHCHDHSSLMMRAVMDGQHDIVKILREKGFDINEPDYCGYTPLMQAACSGRCDVVDYLIELGVDVNAQNTYGETAFTMASAKLRIDIMDRLFAAGANPCIHTHDDRTPLILAVQFDELRIRDSVSYLEGAVNRLLGMGVDVNARNTKDNTALIMAVSAGNSTIIHALIGAGANVNHQNQRGETALMVAAKGSDRARALEVVIAGRRPQREYPSDRLFFENHSRQMDMIVKELIEARADMDLKNEDGQTALQIAEERGYGSIINLLREAIEKKIKIGSSKNEG